MSRKKREITRRDFVKGLSGAVAGGAIAGGGLNAQSRPHVLRDRSPGQEIPEDVNILFIMSDQHRGDFLGLLGPQPELRTPNMDMLAKNGLSFSRAYTPCPLCVPARAAILTGKYPSALDFVDEEGRARDWRRKVVLRDEYTIPEHLSRHGYHTAHFGKGHLRGETENWPYGFQERQIGYITDGRDYHMATSNEIATEYRENGTGHYGGGKEAFNGKYRRSRIDYHSHFDTLVVDRALEFFSRNRNRKFYMQVGIEKPHPLLYPPGRFMDEVDPSNVRLPENWNRVLDENVPERKRERQREQMGRGYQEIHWDSDKREWVRRTVPDSEGWSEEDARNAVAAYIASVNYVDHEIGRLLAGLEAEGLLEKTLIVYTSDHGEMCLDHGMVQKHCGFEAAVRVPLMFYGPGVKKQGHVKEGLAELLDLFPTYCDYLGIERPEGVSGESLMPALAMGEKPAKPIAYSEHYWDNIPRAEGHGPEHEGWENIAISERWKYIDNGRFGPELYDLVNDPGENTNLAFDPSYEAVLRDMKEAMKKRRAACGLPV